MTQINNEIIKNKAEYKQLSEYDQVKISEGKWDGGNWIRPYPYFSYEYGYDKEIYNKLKAIMPVGEGQKKFMEEITKYLKKSERRTPSPD